MRLSPTNEKRIMIFLANEIHQIPWVSAKNLAISRALGACSVNAFEQISPCLVAFAPNCLKNAYELVKN